MDVKFPLENAPKCLDCGRPCQRGVTAASNTNGNADRPYFFCPNSTHGRKFACWDDNRDIFASNPKCDCGLTSRGFKAHGTDWYGCAVGTCTWKIMEACHIDWDAEREEDAPLVPVKIPEDFEWEVTSVAEESPLCSLCRMVLETLRGPRDAVSTTISPELRALAGCHLCAFATRYSIKNPRREDETEPGDCFYQYEYDPIDLGQASLVVLKYASKELFVPYNWVRQATLACLPAKDLQDNALPQRFLGGAFEKTMTLAKLWIQDCEASHPNCKPEPGSSFIPTRVIDVGEKKIFHSHIKPHLELGHNLPRQAQYVTLSHCWGAVVPTKLLTTNLSDFRTQIQFDQLPKTFQDAIVVTQHLGARYLWIDSLCIVQDDEQDWQHESALMVDVYRNAMCNLTAASSQDSSGGLSLDHDTRFTQPLNAWFKTSNEGTTLHNFWPEYVWQQGYQDEALVKRGWILQERLLSRRNLHFKRDQVAWECRSFSACETFPERLPFQEEPQLLKHHLFRVLQNPNRDDASIRDAWDRAVRAYTECDLSFAKDKLIAFGGVAHFFSHLLGNNYAAGLWVKHLSYQLCWTGKRALGAAYNAPSWSWASTQGAVKDCFLPVHPSYIVEQLDLLDVKIDLVSANTYGQVKGASLKVAGRLATAKITKRQHMDRESASLLLPNTSGDYLPSIHNVDLSWSLDDIIDYQQQPAAGGVIYMLEVLHHIHAASEHERAMRGMLQLDRRRAPGSRWLLMVPDESAKATFRRCGTFVAGDWQWERFDEACQFFDQQPGNLPIHSSGLRTKYVVTIV